MAQKPKKRVGITGRHQGSNAESGLEERLKGLIHSCTSLGFVVRRENLARGHSFRVKSGGCVLGSERYLFLDRRLPLSQQLSVLSDFLTERARREA